MSTSNDPNASQTQDGNNSGEQTSDAGSDAFKPITSQDELNEALKKRIERERSKFADYDDLKAKAARLDEIDAANKSELEKAQEAATALQAERDKAIADVLRFRIASEHGITAEDADLFLTGTDEATLTAQAQRLAGKQAERAKNGTRSPNEGRTPPDPKGTTADQFAEWASGQFTR